MAAKLEFESTLTDRYQTTIPKTVRHALKLDKRDKIHFVIRQSGEVILTRASRPEEDDPVLGLFLGFLAQDIKAHPEHIKAIDSDLVKRIESLVGSVQFDLDAPLSAEDE